MDPKFTTEGWALTSAFGGGQLDNDELLRRQKFEPSSLIRLHPKVQTFIHRWLNCRARPRHPGNTTWCFWSLDKRWYHEKAVRRGNKLPKIYSGWGRVGWVQHEWIQAAARPSAATVGARVCAWIWRCVQVHSPLSSKKRETNFHISHLVCLLSNVIRTLHSCAAGSLIEKLQGSRTEPESSFTSNYSVSQVLL